MTPELAKNYAKRCDTLSGSLLALVHILESKGLDEAWIMYHHLDVFESVDKLSQRLTESANRIIEDRPYGPDSKAERPASSRRSAKK